MLRRRAAEVHATPIRVRKGIHRINPSCRHLIEGSYPLHAYRGLSLVEVIIVLALIAVMMALSLPMLSTANAKARSQLCQQNLLEIGQVVIRYSSDTGVLPSITTLAPTRQGQSLPEFLSTQLHEPSVAFCPSDETEQSQVLGTSYLWSNRFNSQSIGQLPNLTGQPLLSDREPYHVAALLPANELVLSRDTTGLGLSILATNTQDHGTFSTMGQGMYFQYNNNLPGRRLGQDPNHPRGQSNPNRREKNDDEQDDDENHDE